MRRIRLGSAATRNADLVAETLLMTAGSFIPPAAIFPAILPRHPLWLCHSPTISPAPHFCRRDY